MLLAIDAGNTNVVAGLWDGSRWKAVWRCDTSALAGASGIAEWLVERAESVGVAELDAAACASVVPELDEPLRIGCEIAFHCPLWFLRPATQNSVEIEYRPPESVGADRIANAIAAKDLVGSPCVVVDIGTATTFDVVDHRGVFIGGAITAGPETMNSSLTAHTRKLPKVPPEFPEKSIGGDTVSALQSGLYWGYAAMIDGLAERISKELGGGVALIATGGLGGRFANHCGSLRRYEPNLTLDGIRLAHARATSAAS